MLEASASPITSLAWSPSGERLVIGSFQVVRVISRAGAALGTLHCDGAVLAVVARAAQHEADRKAQPLRAGDDATRALPVQWPSAEVIPSVGSITSLAWSADGCRIAGGCIDGSAIFVTLHGAALAGCIDLQSGVSACPMSPSQVVITIPAPPPPRTAVDETPFAPDAVACDATVSPDGTVLRPQPLFSHGLHNAPLPVVEEFIYREGITAIASAYGNVAVATTTQLHIYREGELRRRCHQQHRSCSLNHNTIAASRAELEHQYAYHRRTLQVAGHVP